MFAHNGAMPRWQAANLSEAGSISMAAGMDQELCNPTDGRGQAFTLVAQAVKDGLMSQASLDRAAVPFHIAACFRRIAENFESC